MTDINDYLLDMGAGDWGEWLSGWAELIPENARLRAVNRFGDAILVFADGTIHLLDVGFGNLEHIADSQAHFDQILKKGDNAFNWFLVPVVDDCRAAGMQLGPGECYGYKIPPFLGGSYDLDNIEPTSLAVHYPILSDLWQQVKDLPPGTKIDRVDIV